MKEDKSIYQAIKEEFESKNRPLNSDFDSLFLSIVAQIIPRPDISEQEAKEQIADMMKFFKEIPISLVPNNYNFFLESLGLIDTEVK